MYDNSAVFTKNTVEKSSFAVRGYRGDGMAENVDILAVTD